MPIVKRLLCLANSRKLNGRCVAGIELAGNQRVGWIRPVSAREHEEVSEYERQYEDGSDPGVLDVMNVPLIEPRPKGYQQENWLLDPDQYWQKVTRIPWTDLRRLADPVTSLWINGDSTYNGLNDRVPLAQAMGLTSSLRLVRVDELTLSGSSPARRSVTRSAGCRDVSCTMARSIGSGRPTQTTSACTC